MSTYSVAKLKIEGESLVDSKLITPLAIGAATGGIIGKVLFQSFANLFSNENQVGVIQSSCLLIITFGTLVYTLNKDKIETYKVDSFLLCIVIGLVLGMMSSFLGIGGGPINLVVLYYFFSMDTKKAAQNSLYIILFSQIASLLSTLITGNVPEFNTTLLILMVCGGVSGGIIGRKINIKINENILNKLFVGVMIIIMCICVYNIFILV